MRSGTTGNLMSRASSESVVLRLVVSLLGVVAPIIFLWGTYRARAFWFPVPPIPWLQISIFLAASLLLLAAGAFLFRRFGHSLGNALLGSVFFVWFCALFGRGLDAISSRGGSRLILTLALVALMAAVLVLLAEALKRGYGGVIAAVVAVVGLSTVIQHGDAFVSSTSISASESVLVPIENGDVWVLLVDELSSPKFLQGYGENDPRIVGLLEEHGFEVPWAPMSPYDSTYPALTAMFSLEPLYPGIHGPEVWLDSASVFGGDHSLSRSYSNVGRQVVLIEPPITPAYCSEVVTDCHRAILDDFDRFVIQNTAFSFALPGSMGSWPRQGLRQMDVLDEVAELPGSGRLILAHLMLAHAPYTLDAQCRDTAAPGYSTEKYMAQVECLTTKLSGLLEKIPSEAPILIVSDHGISLDPMDSDDQRHQRLPSRLSSFVAVRGCDLPISFLDSNINAFRGFVNCVTDASLEPVSPPPTLTCPFEKDTIELVEIPDGLSVDWDGCDA